MQTKFLAWGDFLKKFYAKHLKKTNKTKQKKHRTKQEIALKRW